MGCDTSVHSVVRAHPGGPECRTSDVTTWELTGPTRVATTPSPTPPSTRPMATYPTPTGPLVTPFDLRTGG